MATDSLLQSEVSRYTRKGAGMVVAAGLTYLYFVTVPWLLKDHYEKYVVLWGSARGVVVWGSFAIDVVVLWSLFLCAFVVYRLRVPFIERCKAESRPWPWDADPVKWREQFRRTLATVLLNLHVLAPLSMYLDSLSGVVMRFDKESYPSTVEIASQMVFFMLVEDCSFYFLHRLLHTSKLYTRVHKQHHEYVNTIAPAALYAHPIEFIFGNMIPVGLGPKLLGGHVHIMTYWLWIVLRDGETIDGHCGYEFSWSPFRLLPLSAGGRYHSFHHSRNVGNFGSFFTLWDSLFGTNLQYYESLKKEESRKQS